MDILSADSYRQVHLRETRARLKLADSERREFARELVRRNGSFRQATATSDSRSILGQLFSKMPPVDNVAHHSLSLSAWRVAVAFAVIVVFAQALTLCIVSFCSRTASPPSPPPVLHSEKHNAKIIPLPSSVCSLSPPVPCVTKLDDNDVPFFAPYHTNITPANPKLQPVTGYSHGVIAAGRTFLAGVKKSQGG
ncbi:uncharacterized protein BT62DRAFT_1006341 [Guyanagaster necrorhizus]|uniref:Transmembrane protein n=1 Tax=Guyanagaster necrorhizus TaxID=856835 RepID=A0A9P7VRJ7_9AGAR|nr:uncharacterized protein BT62DRAFT_1006341 [Guyanagaster necrorhizus MCA 3950]KAG7446131.1 hypothetical protein BT62DRAFT_1006341 [Guyanagaster necrorhizus MCA 3950]